MKFKIVALCLIIGCVTAIAYFSITQINRNLKAQEQERVLDLKLPSIENKISSLQVVRTDAIGVGESTAQIRFQLENKSTKSVIAVTLVSGNERDFNAVIRTGVITKDGSLPILAKPNELFEARMPLSNVLPGFPVKVSSVMYADETVEGEALSIQTMCNTVEEKKSGKKGELPQ